MSDGKVVPLSLVPADPNQGCLPQANVIRFIERLLAKAKSGEAQSVAIVYVASNGFPADGWSRGEDRPHDMITLTAGISCLLSRVTADLNESPVEQPESPEEPA